MVIELGFIILSFMAFKSVSIAMIDPHHFALRAGFQSSFSDLPSNFELVNVVIIARHGDRSQISKSFGSGSEKDITVENFWKSKMPSESSIKKLVTAANVPNAPNPTIDIYCGRDKIEYPYGMLTEEGVQQLSYVGKLLRKKYVGTLLLPSIPKESLYCRSTDFCRTLTSMRSILLGLYELDQQDMPAQNQINIICRSKTEETLYAQADKPCPAMGIRKTELLSNNFVRKNWSSFEKMEVTYNTALGQDPHIDWMRIRDVLISYLSHGIPLPKGLVVEDVLELNQFSGWLWGVLYKDKLYNQLAIGRFLKELAEDIDNAVSGRSFHKLLMYTGHDSTLVPFLCALGIYNDEWPKYSAHVTIEIARDRSSTSLFTRILYNMEEKILPGFSHAWVPYSFLLDLFRTYGAIDYESACNCISRVVSEEELSDVIAIESLENKLSGNNIIKSKL